MDEVSKKELREDIRRMGGKLPAGPFNPVQISGQFNLLVALMMVFFAVAIGNSIAMGDFDTARSLASEAFRDFFLVAIGLFRGMATEKE